MPAVILNNVPNRLDLDDFFSGPEKLLMEHESSESAPADEPARKKTTKTRRSQAGKKKSSVR